MLGAFWVFLYTMCFISGIYVFYNFY